MAVSSFIQIRKKIRESIRDLDGIVWDDTALDTIVNNAQREYSFLSGSLLFSFQVTATENGVVSAPFDYIMPVRFTRTDGLDVPFVSWKYLNNLYPDFRKRKGNYLQGIVTDLDGFRKIRLYPVLPNGVKAGTLYYKRFPKKDVLETTNVDAIVQHCLFQVFLLANNKASGMYYQKFTDLVNAEKSLQRSMSRRRQARGRFF